MNLPQRISHAEQSGQPLRPNNAPLLRKAPARSHRAPGRVLLLPGLDGASAPIQVAVRLALPLGQCPTGPSGAEGPGGLGWLHGRKDAFRRPATSRAPSPAPPLPRLSPVGAPSTVAPASSAPALRDPLQGNLGLGPQT